MLQTQPEPHSEAPFNQAPDVALVIYSMTGGGAERVFLDIAGGLVEMGHKVDLVLADASGPYMTLVPDGVNVVNLAPRSRAGVVHKLAKYLRRRQPGALLSTLLSTNIATYVAHRLAGSKAKVYLREANTLSSYIPSCSIQKRLATHLLLRRAYHAADGVIAVSDGVAHDLRSYMGVAGDKIRTIHNPFRMPFDPAQKPRHPHPYFDRHTPVMIAAGRLDRQKRFDILLRAFADVRKQIDVNLIVFGEGPLRSNLEDLIKELGLGKHADLPGFEPEIFRAMAAANLLVLSSDFEGLPNVLIQALACHLPIVATDCPSGPREILDSGRYGVLVPPSDVGALTSALVEAIRTPRSVDYQAALARFDRTTAVMKYCELLNLEA